MNIDALRQRLIFVAERRLKNRPYDLEQLKREVSGSSALGMVRSQYWDFRLWSLTVGARTILAQEFGYDYIDQDLAQIIDDWALHREKLHQAKPSIKPLPPISALPAATPVAQTSGSPLSLVQLGKSSGQKLKRKALVDKYRDTWPTIDQDLRNYDTNGLSDARANRGWWWEEKARAWAEARGKLRDDSAVASGSPFTRRVHRSGR